MSIYHSLSIIITNDYNILKSLNLGLVKLAHAETEYYITSEITNYKGAQLLIMKCK